MDGLLERRSGDAGGHGRTEPGPELLHEFFERQADARPDRTALECAGDWLTYAAVEAKANQLARLLRSRGIGPGHSVAILLPRSLDPYIALLATLKAGAAYVPLDPDYPEDRVAYIVANSGASLLITTVELARKHASVGAPVFEIDGQASEIARHSTERLSRAECGATSADLCYIIYTSGTTGRPKGVQIEHRSACHFVSAERVVFGLGPDERIYQGFSLAFDASVEEIWLALASGSTLVAGTDAMVHAGQELSRLLTEAGITVVSCVPTLLSMLEDEIPTLRLLILGGEACHQNLVARWCRPGRRMVNTYGPTEATVVATYTDCDPMQPVTIGRPLPGYEIHVLDPAMRPVPEGAPGELHIGGIGLSRGYVGLDELTASKFVPNPFATPGAGAPKLYKTGDLVRVAAGGAIEFLGRLDTQVKVRGFRVELSEIESVLMEFSGVRAAAVSLREDVPGLPRLVGYVVPRDGAAIDVRALRASARSRLPSYMVPVVFETVESLPTLASGKVDRLALPAPRTREDGLRVPLAPPVSDQSGALAEPVAPIEARLLAAWKKLFEPAPVSLTDHFFLDLGGHSLLAARMVSALRAEVDFEALSVLDVYNHPSIESLAEAIRARQPAQAREDAEAELDDKPAPRGRPSSWAFALCGLVQLPALYLVFGIFSLQWLGPYLSYTWLVEHNYEIHEAILGALGALLGVYPVMLLLSIVVKWTVIGRVKPGEYPLWGLYYLRWWIVTTVVDAIPTGYLAGTPLLNLYYRLMGARIGKNVYLGSDNIANYDVLSIGDDTSIDSDASLLGHTVEDGLLKIGEISIGRRCFVGTRAVLAGNTEMADDSALEDLSLLPQGATIPRGERWAGSPAKLVPGVASTSTEPIRRPSLARKLGFGLLHAIGLFIFPVFVIGAIFPGMVVMNDLNYRDDYYWYLLASPVIALSFIVLLCLEIALVKWVLLGRVKPGKYELDSWFYWKKWFVDQLMELSLDVVGPLYSTIYLAPWYRLLGAKLGKRAEISTASFICPDLLEIGDEGFIADCVSLGAARVDRGVMTIDRTKVGRRSFIGNSALLPPGSSIGDNSLIGCLSVPPAGGTTENESSWLGSPALFLPQRQTSTAFSDESTFHPTPRLWALRAVIEYFRVTLPSTGFVALTSLLLSVVLLLHDVLSFWQLIAVFPLLYAAAGAIAALFVVAAKWTLMGRYRPCEKPLWSTFVWRTELLTALHENLADLFLTNMLRGTPYLAWFFRMMGAKIGRRVYLDTTQLTEFDLVTIGDDVALNLDATVQTHLFEDRVMKMSTIRIERGCTVGSLSLVLYDTTMEPCAKLDDLSLLMKGEVLPVGTRWQGIPARRPVRQPVRRVAGRPTVPFGAKVPPLKSKVLAASAGGALDELAASTLLEPLG